jgi:predicted nucleotidyltransferase
MRTSIPTALPLFRSEMQLNLLALLLLQPDREWTLDQLAGALGAPVSSVHRELQRAEAAGLVLRDGDRRPHHFRAARGSPLYDALASLLNATVGVEKELATQLDRRDVQAAIVYGSWPTGSRRPDSDIDVLVVGEADLRDLRRIVRPIGKRAGRTIDLTVLKEDEFQQLMANRSSFARRVLESPTVALVGDLTSLASR